MAKQDYNKGQTGLDNPDTSLDQIVWQRIIVQHASIWRPPTDVYELEDRLVVLIEIAGMKHSDFQIVLQDRHLIISGVRQDLTGPHNVAYHRMEIPRGEFRAHIYIPWNIQRDQITATYHDGLLRIELPQATGQNIHIVDVSEEET